MGVGGSWCRGAPRLRGGHGAPTSPLTGGVTETPERQSHAAPASLRFFLVVCRMQFENTRPPALCWLPPSFLPSPQPLRVPARPERQLV